MARKPIPKILQNDKEYLSLSYAASFCGYHKERLRQLIKENKLTAEKIGSTWFIEESVLQNFIDQNGRQPNKNFPGDSKELLQKIENLTGELVSVNSRLKKVEYQKNYAK